MFPKRVTVSLLSLTPALSRWEREKCLPLLVQTSRGKMRRDFRVTGIVHRLSPLPAGEGQGEGECPAHGRTGKNL